MLMSASSLSDTMPHALILSLVQMTKLGTSFISKKAFQWIVIKTSTTLKKNQGNVNYNVKNNDDNFKLPGIFKHRHAILNARARSQDKGQLIAFSLKLKICNVVLNFDTVDKIFHCSANSLTNQRKSNKKCSVNSSCGTVYPVR